MVADQVYYDYRRYSRNRFEMERDRQDLFGTSSREIIAKRLQPRMKPERAELERRKSAKALPGGIRKPLESFTQGAPESLFLLSRQ